MTPELQDDELLRSYLMGTLPDEDADRLERRLLAEDELFELAEAVEFDLLAAADRGALTPEEREQVLRKLAVSPRGREHLALARSLNAIATEKPASNIKPFVRRPQIFPRPAIRWMALAASLLMVAGLGRFAWQHRAQAPVAVSQVGAQTPVSTPLPRPAVTPIPDRPTVRQEIHKDLPAAVLTFSFLTSRGAEESQKFQISPASRKVEIQIDADGLEPAGSFDVAVRSKKNETILEKRGLVIGPLPWGKGLALEVSADRLPAGKYVLAVTPQGGEEVFQGFEVAQGKKR